MNTKLALTIISVVALVVKEPNAAVELWILYGLYKLITTDL